MQAILTSPIYRFVSFRSTLYFRLSIPYYIRYLRSFLSLTRLPYVTCPTLLKSPFIRFPFSLIHPLLVLRFSFIKVQLF